MKAIYKYKLEIDDFKYNTSILVPLNAKFLKVKNQYDYLVAYYLVDVSEDRKETHNFIIIETGHIFPDDYTKGYEYLTTINMNGGQLVWHIFKED